MKKYKTYSFIDFELEDFLRYEGEDVIKIESPSFEEVEDWLLKNGEKYGWTNTGVKYWCWEDEFGEEI